MTKPITGTRAQCKRCGNPILFVGPYWEHEGKHLHHVAEPRSFGKLEPWRRNVVLPSEFPTIVCLCGSTRFWRAFQAAGLRETMAGKIVLSIGAASGTDDEHFGNLPRGEYDRIKTMLDELHMRKIDLCDEVLILNVNDYIGESTARELAYAQSLGKVVRYLEPRP